MPSPNLDSEETATAPQSERAQLRLRELVVGGGIKPGVRITELALVERLGMSRTPIRAALVRLQEEGLLEALPGGGFTARAFSHADICDAIELRGTLEGLAARMAAERGADASLARVAQDCVQQLDEVLAPPQLSAAAFSRYVKLNGQLHSLLAQMSGSPLVQRQIERACMLPFASPSSFVIVHTTGTRARDRLVIAHEQRNAQVNLADALQNQRALQRVRGAGLIRRST